MKLSPNATTVLEKRYLKKDNSGKPIEHPEDMFVRVAETVAGAEALYGTPDPVRQEVQESFYRVMTALEFLPNSPTLMNAGRELGQLSACFVLPVEDSMEAIFETVKNTALIHKSGGGTGFAFSRLRPAGDCVQTTKGVSSGPISFMEVFNAATETIKQGGTRRGANMGILRVDHPDIMAFISCKSEGHRLTNFNLSVGITETFMRAVERDEEYDLINPRTRTVEGRLRAREVFDQIVQHAWKNGEPGIIFLDRLNRDNPTPEIGEIESTNPCVYGDALVPTELGLVRMEDLAQGYGPGGISVLVDGRVPALQQALRENASGSGTGVAVAARPPAVQCVPMAQAMQTGARETVRVVTRSGYEVVVTPDHQILTTQGWVEAGRLRPGRDRVLIQGGPGLFNQDRRLPVSVPEPLRDRNGRAPQSAFPTLWSEDLGMVLGWLVAHGGLRSVNKDNSIIFQFGGEDLEIMTYLRPRLHRWFGRESAPTDRRGKGATIVFRSKLLADFLLALGIEAVRPEDRRVPRSIFTASREAVVGFLRALFTAHGTVSYADGRSTIRLTVRSERLLKDVQLLLLNLGIRSRQIDPRREIRKLFVYAPSPLREARESGYAAPAEDRSFHLEISRDQTTRFFERVGFVSSRYKLRIGVPRSRTPGSGSFDDEVTKVEPAGTRPVYDLVEPLSRSFVANGIVVHNCGEQPLLPYESCNLGSINLSLMTRRDKGRVVVDWDRLGEVVRVAVRFLDNVIDVNRYPLPAIEEMTRGNRKIGLGVMGFADMLIKMGIPYDSGEAIAVAGEVMKFIKEKSYAASAELAEARGSFPNVGRSRFRNNGASRRRNATLTTIAPTGTLSIIAGCSSGVEPLFALSYVRNVLDGQQLVEVNDLFEAVARERGFYSDELMKEIARRGSVRGLDEVPEDVQRVFVTAHDISPEWHIRMQAAFQEHVDNAVSKTVNFPHHATSQDVADVYRLAFELGCKGVTVYRDGSRDSQVLSTGTTAPARAPEIPTSGRTRITPRARPEVTIGSTEKIQTGCGTLYITINEDEDGLCEVFTQMGKSGGCTASQAEATSRMVSLALRTGVDPDSIIRQLKGIRCPAPSWQNGAAILSCPDAIAKAIERYINKDKPMLPGFDKVPVVDKKTPAVNNGRGGAVHDLKGLCPQCPDCGEMLEVIEGCVVCRHCGYSQC